MTNTFRPVNAQKKLSSEQIENVKVLLEEIHTLAQLDIHQCLNFDDFILIKFNGKVKADTNITIKNPRQIKDRSKEFPKALQSTIRNMKQEHNLTVKQLNEIKKDVEKLEEKQTKIPKQIKYIEDMAPLLKEKSDLEKAYRRLMKNYQAFSESLNDNLLEFEDKRKKEIKTELKKLEKIIQEYRTKL